MFLFLSFKTFWHHLHAVFPVVRNYCIEAISMIILEIRQNWIYFSLYQYTGALHFSIISSSLFLTFGGVYHIFTSCFIKFSAADIDEKALSITV